MIVKSFCCQLWVILKCAKYSFKVSPKVYTMVSLLWVNSPWNFTFFLEIYYAILTLSCHKTSFICSFNLLVPANLWSPKRFLQNAGFLYCIYRIIFQQSIIKFSSKYPVTEFFISSVTYEFRLLLRKVKFHDGYFFFIMGH